MTYYAIIVVFIFLFLCVGYLSQYFSIYHNINFSLFGRPYNYRKYIYTLESRHLDPNCCNVLFTKKNNMYNELKIIKLISYKKILQITYTQFFLIFCLLIMGRK